MRIYWRMDTDTYRLYIQIMDELEFTSPDYNYERYQTLMEELRMLDGFPKDIDEDYDIVVPILEETRETIDLVTH